MKKVSSTIWVIGGIILLLVIIFGGKSFLTLQPGEKGVVFRTFKGGLDKEKVFGQGFHVIAPWNKMIIYNVLEQKREEPMDILDKNGMSINVDVTLLFHPMHTQIGYIHEKIGIQYADVKVIPVLRSAVREVMGRYTAEEIYSRKRQEVEGEITKMTRETLEENDIEMKQLLIRSVNLPTEIKNAIENKLKQEQEALAYQYKLEREKSEAERKRIAAEGEARANKIINSSLTTNLLKMRGIEATIKLSESQNTKVIVIGSSKDGLPLILGNN